MTVTQGEQPASDPAAGPVRGRRARLAGTGVRRKRNNRSSAMLVSGLLAAALGIAAVSLPVPYVIESPGPTFNTIGQDNGKPVISVSGHETFPAKGSLDLTTVYVDGGPNGPVSVVEAFSAWLNGTKAVYPQELLFPSGVTKEQSQQESATAMTTSQENAVAAALKDLNIPFGQKMQVAGLPDDSASKGLLQAGDVLVSINDKPITALGVVQAELAAGNGKPVKVIVERAGARVPVTVTPTKNSAGRYILGVLLQYKFTFPFNVTISLDKVGGPSAGMMFALGIIDTVTPGDLTGGKHIAGTGTITPDGAVGPIGGIAQKMQGARSAGATLFLAPAANCDDVLGHIPDRLQVVRVENLTEARKAVELAASGGDTSGLPVCTSN
ncbi:S16 family serine protease [Arthrobacter sp. ES3-54]|uniref:YlbL family protein n=1 Tax=Arthrobacter sp. ES3-54 TaxID=1502991 RepID=UPI0024071E30|nr:S16 family serine protease [Arthrobacter sp. ES3-54]MDF9748821.1 PDZ domain-containing protein [Arthrobacter sp. ES3-54]